VNLRVGIYERENRTASISSTTVSNGADRALLDRDNDAAAIGRDPGCRIRRTIIGDDDFDGICSTTVSLARSFDGIEKAWQVLFLVEGRNHDREGRRAHGKLLTQKDTREERDVNE
jgi:hypothetical protein